MYGEKTDRTLDYTALRAEIIAEAEQLNRINLATAYNNQVHAFYPLCVFIDLNAYIVLTEQFIWVREIEHNPNVVLNTYNKQFYGTAKLLGDPYDDRHWRIRKRFKKKTQDNVGQMHQRTKNNPDRGQGQPGNPHGLPE